MFRVGFRAAVEGGDHVEKFVFLRIVADGVTVWTRRAEKHTHLMFGRHLKIRITPSNIEIIKYEVATPSGVARRFFESRSRDLGSRAMLENMYEESSFEYYMFSTVTAKIV